MTKSATNKVDIIQLLNRIDQGDFEFYDSLPEDSKKTISFVVLSRWLSCTKNQKQVVAVNTLLNPMVYKLAHNHKSLLYKLMLIASSGTEKQYRWIAKGKKTNKKPESVKLLQAYYKLNKSKAIDYLNQFSLDELLECADGIGYDAKEIKKIKNEFA